MFDFGFIEMLVIGLILLLVVGPERLPEVARSVGSWVSRAKGYVESVTSELDQELHLRELDQQTRKATGTGSEVGTGTDTDSSRSKEDAEAHPPPPPPAEPADEAESGGTGLEEGSSGEEGTGNGPSGSGPARTDDREPGSRREPEEDDDRDPDRRG